MCYEFGEYCYDTGRMELRRGGETIHLAPKVMTLLEVLLAKRPNVVLQQELYDRLWPSVIVQHTALKNLMAVLRTALDDHEREGRFIRTVHGRGYAFADCVVETRGVGDGRVESRAVLVNGLRRIGLWEGENVAGRAHDVSLHLDGASVSRRHARITVDGSRVTLEDLGSRNGTFVRGVRIEGSAEAYAGDEIRLGVHTFALHVSAARADSSTASFG